MKDMGIRIAGLLLLSLIVFFAVSADGCGVKKQNKRQITLIDSDKMSSTARNNKKKNARNIVAKSSAQDEKKQESTGRVAPNRATEYFSGNLMAGIVVDDQPVDGARIREFSEKTGFLANFVVFFQQWPDPVTLAEKSSFDESLFPARDLKVINDSGAMPCITWEPVYYSQLGETAVEHKALMNGVYDSYIHFFARQGKALDFPVMMRFGRDMNLEKNHWGGDRESYGPESPNKYKEMYKKIHGIFKEEGADNFLWAFCPNSETVPNISWDESAGWNTIEAYYPGDDFVDIMGVNGYNWGNKSSEEFGWESRFRSFDEIFRSSIIQLKGIAPNKPLLIFETASSARGGNKLAWVADAWNKVKDLNLYGLAWYQGIKDGEDLSLECVKSPDGSDDTVFNHLLQFHTKFITVAQSLKKGDGQHESFIADLAL